MAEVPPDPLIGKVLNGRFTILEPLGVGGMGKVYKAMQSPLDRMVALKVLNPKYSGTKDPGFERRFFLEAAMTAKLHHPNTITVHDYGRTDDGIYFIAMEHVEGETLQARLARDTTLPWPRALHIAGQIARSLREAHKAGMIHRDLKPANVMLLQDETDSDMVKVLDFGLVKSLLPDGPLSPTDTELTQAGVLLGSPLYMAPEQARNEADARSDIYALGVLLYQTIGGKPPFTGKESIDIIVKHIREKPAPLKTLIIDLPVEVNALVMKCLEKEPANRFQSMEELLEAMRVAGANAGMSGAFSDPRSMVYRTSSSQAVKVVSPSMLMTPPADLTRAERGTASGAIEVPWEDTGAISKKNSQRVALISVGAAVGLAVLLGIVLLIRKPAVTPPAPLPKVAVKALPPKVEDPTPVVEPRVEARPAAISFSVSTNPSGASVTRAGIVIGVTPLSFALPPGPDHSASAELTFMLEGYQNVTVMAQGTGPEVVVKQTMPRLKKATVKKNTPNPPGYKDDPYQ